MEGKSYKKSMDHLEMSDRSKTVRKILMDLAPDAGVSKNDLFNRGYGSFISLIFTIAFVVTFLYYAVTNSQYNKTAKFLVPKKGGEIKGDMYCQEVSIALSNTYAMDSFSTWNTNKYYLPGASLYGLEVFNAEFKNEKAYKKQIQKFADDLRANSAPSVNNDFSWNIVFGASYSTVDSAGDGRASLFVDGDARLMYDVPIYASGISNMNGTCVPSPMYYDGTKFEMDIYLEEGQSFCSQLRNDTLLARTLGLYSDDSNRGYLYSYLTVDAAAITTAIAINYNITTLDSLDRIPSLDIPNLYLKAYMDSSYAPMQPVFCFDLKDLIDDDTATWADSFTALCLVKIGETYAYPITSHYGQMIEGSFLPEACDCTKKNEQVDCQSYDINIGLLFYPVYDFGGENFNVLDLMSQILDLQSNARDHGVSMQTMVQPMMTAAVEASFYVTPADDYSGGELSNVQALHALNTSFSNICPECYILTIELFDNAHMVTGPTINKGGRTIVNMSCENVFYNEEVLDQMAALPPADITEAYMVCTDSLSKAVSEGISNAYASAGLYTSVVLVVLMMLIGYYNDWFQKDSLHSEEEKEIIIRNAIVDVLDYLLQKNNVSIAALYLR